VSTGPTQPTQGRRIALASAAVVVVVLLVVLVVVLLNRGDDDSPSSSSPTTPNSAVPTSPGVKPTLKTRGPKPSVPPVVKNPPKNIRAKLTEPVTLDNGVAVEVTRIESVQGKAQGVGEVAGPALRFTVQVKNQSKKPLDLDLAIVNAYFGKKDDPAIALEGPGGEPLPQKLGVGDTASGKYVFKIPTNERARVRVDFSYTIDQSTIIFRGPGT
jgi:hypothetical protein